MKSALTVVLFLLFAIGVCVDGKEESVSVTEGDSVTLKSGVTERQTDDGIEWRFSGIRIAKISSDSNEIWVKPDGSFRDRLQLDSQTGDLKISNIRTTDSGLYKVKISSPRGSSEIIFTVKVVSAAAVKSVSVLEGDSVTLHTDPTYIHNVVQWKYGQQKSLVAEINRAAGIFNTYDGPDERLRDRLKLDQAGSLIITNTRTTDSGLYEVEISSTSSRHTIHHTQSFNVTVRVTDALKSVSVKEGETVTLPITEIQKDDLIQWMFEDTVLAEINKADQRFYTSNGPDGRFRARLNLDHQTGSLIITNTRTTHSGLYELKISSSRRTMNRRIIVIVTAVPDPGWSSAAVAGIGVGVCFLLGAAAVVIYYRCKRSRDAVKSVKKGDPVTLPITEIQSNDQIQWMFEDTVLAEINKADLPFFRYDGPEGRFRDRLKLDHQTGSLIITDTRTTDSGLYEVKISSSRDVINQRFFVLVTGLSPGEIVWIGVVGVVEVLLGAAAGVINCCYKKSRNERRENESQQLPDYCSDEGESAGSGPKSIQKRNLTADYSADAKKLFKNQLQLSDYCSDEADYCSDEDELSEAQLYHFYE